MGSVQSQEVEETADNALVPISCMTPRKEHKCQGWTLMQKLPESSPAPEHRNSEVLQGSPNPTKQRPEVVGEHDGLSRPHVLESLCLSLTRSLLFQLPR